MRGNNLGPVDKTVSILIDRSYPVVKAVYENLEAIAFLQENSESWKYLYENFNKIEEVSQAAQDVNIVVENLETILNAEVYGEQAKTSAEAAKASETASKNSQDAAKASEDNAKKYSDAAKTYLDQTQEIAQDMSDLGDAIEIVADNIDSVNTDATHINQINIVASDFNGNTTIISMPDWGEVGVEQLLPEVPTGGNIFTVAQNMQHVIVDSENIDVIKKVALGLDNIPEIEATFVGYVNQAQDHAHEAEQARAGAEDALSNTIMMAATVTDELPKIQAEGAKQVNLVAAEGKTQIKAVQAASTKEQEIISTAGDAQISLVQSEGSTQIGNVQDAATEAISDVESTKEGVVQAVTDEGTKQIGLVQAEGTKQVKVVQDASPAEIAKVQQAGSDQIELIEEKATEIDASVELAKAWASKMDAPVEGQEYSAKYWANQASAGQLQSDWQQSDSEAKDFIKNKPVLGALAAKDSLNYSELVGTPPAQDLTPYLTKADAANTYATKVNLDSLAAQVNTKLDAETYTADKATFAIASEVQIKLDTKAEKTHNHTIADITDLQTALNEKLPSDLGEVGVD